MQRLWRISIWRELIIVISTRGQYGKHGVLYHDSIFIVKLGLKKNFEFNELNKISSFLNVEYDNNYIEINYWEMII